MNIVISNPRAARTLARQTVEERVRDAERRRLARLVRAERRAAARVARPEPVPRRLPWRGIRLAHTGD